MNIPSELTWRYQNDAAFRCMVEQLARFLDESDGQMGAADVREASVVAEELCRQRRIRKATMEVRNVAVGDQCP